MEKKSERSIGWLVEEIMKGSVEKNRNRQEQELIRRGEFRDRTERLVRNLMVEELEKAREEGKREQAELDRALYSVSFEHIKNADFEKILLESVKKAREEGKLEVLEELLEWDTPLEPIGKFMRLQTKMVEMKRDLLNLLKTEEDEK